MPRLFGNCAPPSAITFPPAQPNQNCYTPCNGCRQRQLAAIANEEGDYGLIPEDELYNLKRDVFEQLMAEPELMEMGTADDIILQLFYNNALNENMGQLINAENILLNDTLGLNAFLSTFNPENNAEQNMQTVLEIYEATFGMQPEEFSQDQINTLLSIALQSPISGGEAVYIARGMLHLDVDDLIDENNQRKSQVAGKQITENAVMLYPNPANNSISIDLNGAVADNILFRVFDNLNKEIMTKGLHNVNNSINVSVDKLPNGIYTYSILVGDHLTQTGKLVIIH